VIAVLDYGIGNLRSAEKALQRIGADARLTADPEVAASARALVLPGVGAFGACARALRRTGLWEVAAAAIAEGRPFLGICVGFQLLYEGSDEDPAESGFGVLPGRVRRLSDKVKVPQMQWNRLTAVGEAPSGLLAGVPDPTWVYFVHSYAPDRSSETTSVCDYGGLVVATAERERVWGAQFHPEKSGAVGLAVLANFVRASADR
jgi:glutamine amidotransferase